MDAATNTPLELATVSILGGDSSLITYQLSDKNGKFTFGKLPQKKKLLVNVTYTGYIGYYKSVQLDTDKTDTLAISLALNFADTNAVVVTATIPIRMNGDTLEINPAAFKMKPNAVVEELLNQVGGIVIWADGSITYNGKPVQNLLVDGKPFMGTTDPRVATQNLPKTAIDKIQLYQEFDRTNIGPERQSQDSLLTMNIKLKESSKKGYFGKAGIGYGTTNRFESDLSFQVYNKKSSIGVGGGYNNINKNIGNLQELFQNNTYRNFNPNLYNVGNFGANGINKNHSVGGVFTHSFIETANSRQNNRIAVNYNKAGTNTYLTDLNLQNRTTIANPQFIREEGVQNNRNYRQELGVNYVKTNSYNDNLNVNGSVNSSNESGNSVRFTEVRDSTNGLQNTNAINMLQSRQSDNESLSVNFSKSDREDPLKSFSVQFNGRRNNSVSDRTVRSEFASFTNSSRNIILNRNYKSTNYNLNMGGSMDYQGFKRLLLGRYNFFGIGFGFSQRINYARWMDDTRVSDFDSSAKIYVANSNISNENKREVFEYTPSITISKDFSKWKDAYYQSLYVQVRILNDIKNDKNESSFSKRNLDRSFRFFRYEGNINFQRNLREKYLYHMSVNYSKSFDYPSIDQLYTIVDDVNAYEIRTGNPDLQNRINHRINFNANFNTQNQKSLYAINSNIGGNHNRSLNPVVDSINNDLSGKRRSFFINAGESNNLNLYYNFNVSRRFGKSKLQLQYNGNYNTGKQPNYIDGVYNISETGNLFNQVNLQYSLRSILILNVGKNLQHFKTEQSAAGLTSFKNNNQTTKLGIVLNYPANFTFSSTMDHIANSNLNKPVVLWNAFTSYRFMKQQGELKFAAMDLLKQYQNITNSVNAFGTTTRITNGLQQFFLLTFSYFPRKFGKTEIKRAG